MTEKARLQLIRIVDFATSFDIGCQCRCTDALHCPSNACKAKLGKRKQCFSCVWPAVTLGREPSVPRSSCQFDRKQFEPSQDAGMRQVLSVQVD